MKIGRFYRFEAAHHLPLLPEGHKCHRLHGHNYRVEAQVDDTLDHRGFVLDFAELDAVVAPLIASLDHRLINDLIPNPTAENIALWLFGEIQQQIHNVCIVRVWENDDCWAECGRNWDGIR